MKSYEFVEVITKLRKKTGLPMLECKRLAEQSGYDFDKACRLAGGLPMEETEDEIADATRH